MDVLREAVHRTLAYIALVNSGGARPSVSSVNEFLKSSTPKGPPSRFADLSRMIEQQVAAGPAESGVEYLARLEWIRLDGERTVGLTKVGHALVRALDAAEQEEQVVEAVLDVDDPFAYAKAVTYLRTEEPALLVDPYLRMAQLIELQRAPGIQRVLVSTKLRPEERADLARGAEIMGATRTLEVRETQELHDRYLIPTNGGVLMLGGSLNTIGRAPITLTTLSEALSGVVREQHEKMWSEAKSVQPPTLASDAPADSENAGA